MLADALYRASWQGAIVFLLVLGVSALPGLTTPKVRLWLWRLVFVKFALSLLCIGAVSIPVLTPPAAEAAQTTEPDARVAEEPAAGPDGRSGFPLLACGWLVGACGVGGLSLLAGARSSRLARQGVRNSSSRVSAVYRQVCREMRVARCPDLLFVDSDQAPLLLGGLRPQILLSEQTVAELPDEDLRMIMAHELAHVAHRDLIWQAFAGVVRAAFFFHPLVWLSVDRLVLAAEMAADEAAIRFSGTSPRRYGETLVRLAVVADSRPYGLAMARPYRSVQRRLIAMQDITTGRSPWKVLASIVVMAVAAATIPTYSLAQAAATSPASRATLPVPVIAQSYQQAYDSARAGAVVPRSAVSPGGSMKARRHRDAHPPLVYIWNPNKHRYQLDKSGMRSVLAPAAMLRGMRTAPRLAPTTTPTGLILNSPRPLGEVRPGVPSGSGSGQLPARPEPGIAGGGEIRPPVASSVPSGMIAPATAGVPGSVATAPTLPGSRPLAPAPAPAPPAMNSSSARRFRGLKRRRKSRRLNGRSAPPPRTAPGGGGVPLHSDIPIVGRLFIAAEPEGIRSPTG